MVSTKIWSYKLVTIISFLLMCNNVFGQLVAQSHEEKAGYKTVYKHGIGVNHVEVRFSVNSRVYFLCGGSDNQFEDDMITIYLGDSKEAALKTLEDLKNIDSIFKDSGEKTLVVQDFRGKMETTIYQSKFLGTWVYYAKSEHVAGQSLVVTNVKKDNKIIKAVTDFEE